MVNYISFYFKEYDIENWMSQTLTDDTTVVRFSTLHALDMQLFVYCPFNVVWHVALDHISTINLGTVSESGTGPLDCGARGPVPDPEPRL